MARIELWGRSLPLTGDHWSSYQNIERENCFKEVILLINVSFAYCSKLPMQDCVKFLMQPPLHFKIQWIFSRDYEIEKLSDSELIITFTKGHNLSNHKTKYKVTLSEQCGVTIIVLKFIDERGLSPFPMVTDWEITKFLKSRIDADQIKWQEEFSSIL